MQPTDSECIGKAANVLAYLVLAAACAASALASAQGAAKERFAGAVEFLAGDVMIEPLLGAARLPKEGERVQEGDTITTFQSAEIHMRMADGAYLSVRENTKLKVAAYVANGDEADLSVIELTKGVFRAVTGWIGRKYQRRYEVRTPIVTIGVRGTDHEPSHLPHDDPRGAPGSYDKVHEGATVMRIGERTVDVPASKTGFLPPIASVTPRLLERVPEFYRPAPNETRFVQRAQESVRTVDRQVGERREQIRLNPALRTAPTPAGRVAPFVPRGLAPAAANPPAVQTKPAVIAPRPAAVSPGRAPVAPSRPAAATSTNRVGATKATPSEQVRTPRGSGTTPSAAGAKPPPTAASRPASRPGAPASGAVSGAMSHSPPANRSGAGTSAAPRAPTHATAPRKAPH